MPEHSGIFFTDTGKGDPVVFIHGFCETHEIWNSLAARLSNDYRIICLDLPGFGKSASLAEPFSIADVASRVLDLLDALGIKSCVLVGHSLGGYVALEIANQRSSILKGFCLFHSTAFPDSEEKKLSRNKVIDFVTNHGVAPFVESFIPPLFYDQSNQSIPAAVSLALTTPKSTLLAFVRAMRDRPDRTDVLRTFSGPILFIAGDKDTGIPSEIVRKQAEFAKKATLCIIQGVAHMGMFEKEELAFKQINQFLRSD